MVEIHRLFGPSPLPGTRFLLCGLGKEEREREKKSSFSKSSFPNLHGARPEVMVAGP